MTTITNRNEFDATRVPPVSQPLETVLRRPERIRGNLSLWFFALAIALFKLWSHYVALPGGTQIELMFGLVAPSVDALSGFFNFLLGWLGLTALVSVGQLRRVFIEFFNPINLIEDANLRQFFASPATTLFGCVTLIGTIMVIMSVWVVEVTSTYEVITRLSETSRARLIDVNGNEAAALRVDGSGRSRILLGGFGSTGVVFIRDKYNLRTLEALKLRRTLFGYSQQACSRNSGEPNAAFPGLRLPHRRRLEIVGPLRWASDTVRTPLELADGRASERGWIRAGDGMNGPERGGPPYAQRFLDQLFMDRALFGEWASAPTYAEESGVSAVHHRITGYSMTVQHESSNFQCPDGETVMTRDATVLRSREIPRQEG